MKRDVKGRFIKGSNGNTYEGFGIWYDKKGYPTIFINGKNIKLHVYIWEKINGEKPKGMQLHHKDNNKKNYDLNNLELVNQSDHFKIHAGWIKENAKWIGKPCKDCKQLLPLDKFYPRKGLTPCNYCLECAKERWKKEAKEKGIKPRRWIKPNYKGEYQCVICMKWKVKELHKFSNKKPQSYCKYCFNIKQKELRRLRK